MRDGTPKVLVTLATNNSGPLRLTQVMVDHLAVHPAGAGPTPTIPPDRRTRRGLRERFQGELQRHPLAERLHREVPRWPGVRPHRTVSGVTYGQGCLPSDPEENQ